MLSPRMFFVSSSLLFACGASEPTVVGDAGDAGDAADVGREAAPECPAAEADRKPEMFIGTTPVCAGCPPLLSANVYSGKPCGTAAPSCLMAGPAWSETLACCNGVWKSKMNTDAGTVNPCQ